MMLKIKITKAGAKKIIDAIAEARVDEHYAYGAITDAGAYWQTSTGSGFYAVGIADDRLTLAFKGSRTSLGAGCSPLHISKIAGNLVKIDTIVGVCYGYIREFESSVPLGPFASDDEVFAWLEEQEQLMAPPSLAELLDLQMRGEKVLLAV